MAILTFPLVAFGGYKLHPVLLNYTGLEWGGFVGSSLYLIGWVGVLILTICICGLSSLALVMITAGLYEAKISAIIFENNGITTSSKQTLLSTAIWEISKLSLLLSISLLSLLTIFFPLFTPLGLLLASWAVGVEFYDVALEQIGLSKRERIKECFSSFFSIAALGAIFGTLWPVLGFFLPPLGVAAASFMVVEKKVGKRSH